MLYILAKTLEFLVHLFMTVSGYALAIFLLFFIPTNLIGILIGFESHSPGCGEYRNNNMSRFSRIMFVSAPIACEKNTPLLQPYMRDLGHWLTEVPK